MDEKWKSEGGTKAQLDPPSHAGGGGGTVLHGKLHGRKFSGWKAHKLLGESLRLSGRIYRPPGVVLLAMDMATINLEWCGNAMRGGWGCRR